MDTGDAVTEYRDCVCDGAACSCVPSMQCGSTSVCERNLAAGRVQTLSFTALNCGDQESSVSTLTTAGASGRLTLLQYLGATTNSTVPVHLLVFSSCCSCTQ